MKEHLIFADDFVGTLTLWLLSGQCAASEIMHQSGVECARPVCVCVCSCCVLSVTRCACVCALCCVLLQEQKRTAHADQSGLKGAEKRAAEAERQLEALRKEYKDVTMLLEVCDGRLTQCSGAALQAHGLPLPVAAFFVFHTAAGRQCLCVCVRCASPLPLLFCQANLLQCPLNTWLVRQKAFICVRCAADGLRRGCRGVCCGGGGAC